MIRLEQFRMTNPVAPLQFEGVDDEGVRWYFRSRYGEWVLANGFTLDAAIGATVKSDALPEKGQLVASGVCVFELTSVTALALMDVLLTAVTE